MPEIDKSISISDFRESLSNYLRECVDFGRRLVLTHRGESQAVVISMADWNSMMETLEVLSNPEMMAQIIASEADIKAGRTHPASAIFDQIDHDLAAGDE